MDNAHSTDGTEHSFSVLLETAADNDVEGFKRSVCDESEISEVGLWYGHQRVLKRGVLEHRTPLMIAAKYGSLDVLKLILSLPEVDVNFSCGPDKSTALHCAASGGSVNVIYAVELLLLAGADPNCTDANGHRPVDVIVASPNSPTMKIALEKLLKNDGSASQWDLQVSTNSLGCSSPFSLSSSEVYSFSASCSILSPVTCKHDDVRVSSAKKEYPVDPSTPDIKNSMYTTDEFRMFSFKIQPCSRAYPHDWTECPFVHPGENARRRDPRRFHYSCVPCPDHRKGTCRNGDLCEYSHGIFECWLHPAQYRTRLCKDGTSCTRRVCFFAHTSVELRPLCTSTGSAVSFPQATAVDLTALNLFSGSPSAVSAISPLSFTPPMSPSGNDICKSTDWSQQNISNLMTIGNILQASRLRTSLNARDVQLEELNRFRDFDLLQFQLLNELSSMPQPQPHHNTSSTNLRQLNASNLDRLFSSEVSSLHNSDQMGASLVFSSPYKPAVYNEFQQRSRLSPIKTGHFSPKNVDYSPLQASFSSSSPRKMSLRLNEPASPTRYPL